MLQPKNIKKQKGLVWRSFTFIDFGLLLAFGAIALAIGFNVFEKGADQWKKLISTLAIFLLLLPLLMNIPKYNCRCYFLLIYMFIFLFRKKKYKNKETSLLVPYESIVENSIIKTKPLKSGRKYFSVIKFVGKSPWSEEQEDCNRFLNSFNTLLDGVDLFATIIRTKELSDYHKNIESLRFEKARKLAKVNNPKAFDNYFHYYEQVQNDLELLDTNALVDNYYLVIYHGNINELKISTNTILDTLYTMDINANLLKGHHLVNFLAYLNNIELDANKVDDLLIQSSNELEINNNSKGAKLLNKSNKQQIQKSKTIKLDELLKPKEMKFKFNHFIKDNKYCSVQVITALPIQLEDNWANSVFNNQSKIIWHLGTYSDNQKELILDKASKRIEDNKGMIKSQYKRGVNMLQLEAIDYLQEQLIINQNNLFNSWLLILNECDDLKSLQKLERDNLNKARKHKIQLSSLPFRQFEAYSQTTLITTENINDNVQMSSHNIAHGWAFENESINDKNFLIQGLTHSTSEPIIFNQFFKKSARRVNYNMFTLGSSGKGKSTDVKKQVLSNLAHNNKVYIVDPQNEYKRFGSQFDATLIDLGSGYNTKINPLQIQINLFDEDVEYSPAIVINKHLEWLEQFFYILEPNFTNDHIMIIINTIKEIYQQLGCYDVDDVSELNNFKYPILSDLINAIDNYKYIDSKDRNRKEEYVRSVYDRLCYLFTNNGKYEHIYNAQTNIDLSSEFIIFNTSKLSSKNDDVSSKLGLFVLLSFLSNQLYKNFITSSKQNTLIVIDELHMYIDINSTTTLDFVYTLTKTVRKFNGGMLLCTQNPSDFTNANIVSTKAQAILMNCQYAKFFGLKQNDLNAVAEMFRTSGGLTKTQELFLLDSDIGNCLFSLHAYSKLRTMTYYNEYEKQLFFDKGEIGNNYDE